MTKEILRFTALVLLVASCGTSLQFVDPDYKGKTLSGGTLAIVDLRTSEINLQNLDDVKDDIGTGENSVTVYKAFFDSVFHVAVRQHSTFQKLNRYALPDSFQIDRSEMTIGEKSLIVRMPNAGQKLNIDEKFVLIFNVLDVYRKPGEPGFWIPGPNGTMAHTGGKSEQLRHEVSYTLWDNETTKAVSYGRAEIGANVLFAMTRQTWVSVIDGLANEIFKNGPFHKQVGYASR